MADPISAAATAFANWLVGAAAAGTPAYVAAYSVAYVGLSAAVTVGLGAIAQSQVPDPEAQKITRKQARPLRCYAVGGASRMSGPYMLWESTANKLGVVIAVCEGRLSSISQVYLNDDAVSLSGGFVQGMANEKYGSGDLVRLETRLGASTETHYSFLTADFGTEWPTTSRGDGVASLGMLAIHRSRESYARHFPNGEPIPSVVGAPVCYDWRQDTTAGGSGSQRRNDETTWGPSANPIVWMVHQEWARFGRSWTRCIEPVLEGLTDEADYCDDLVSDGDSGTEVRYRVAGNYPANTEPDAVRRMLLASMDGWMSVNGKGHLILKAGRYVEPTFTITGEHIEGYTWRAFQTAEESINSLVVSYVSPDHDYTEIEAGTFSNEDDITDAGRENSEPLQLTWVNSPTQAMRLARRKMSRLTAERRGTIRTGIYGLNGLGERFIRVQNPEMASMADVVVEVMNVEVDFASSQVIFDVILADETIDDAAEPPVITVTPPVTPTTQGPSTEEPAVRPVTRNEVFPTSATEDTVTILSFGAVLPDGKSVAITGATVTGLDASTTYGVFWKDGTGVEVEAYPATTRMETGGWVFLGWQATHDGSGDYPAPPAPPGGYGGSGAADDFVEPTWDALPDLPTWATDDRVPNGLDTDGSVMLPIPGSVIIASDIATATDLSVVASDLTTLDASLGDLAVLDSVDLATAQVTGKSLANLDAAADTKLSGIQAGAQVNPADLAALDGTAATKLAGIQAGAQVNPANLAALDSAAATKLAGIETGATDDSTVTALSADLLSGAVKPAEAVTFTGKGDLATKNTAATADLAANAATKGARYDSASETDWVAAGIATGPITSRATVFSTSITATGAEVIVDGSFFLRLQHSQDDVVLYVVVERNSTGGGGTVDVFLAGGQSLAIGGDGFVSGWQVISFTDTPPAGTVSYFVRVYHTYSIGSPGGFVTWKHRNRTMSFLETKR